MAVTLSAALNIEPLPAADKRFPLAFWWQAASQAGDASGGQLTIQFTLPRAGNRLYSIELYSFRHDAVAVQNLTATWNINKLGLGSIGLRFRRGFVPVLQDGLWIPSENARLWFDGIFQPTAGDGTLLIATANAAAITLEAQAWGYLWGSEVLQLAGGPLRPGQVPVGSEFALR